MRRNVLDAIRLTEDAAVNENVVDTTLVYDWSTEISSGFVGAESWPENSKQVPMKTSLRHLHLRQYACCSCEDSGADPPRNREIHILTGEDACQDNERSTWHQRIGGLCVEAELEAFPGAPTIEISIERCL